MLRNSCIFRPENLIYSLDILDCIEARKDKQVCIAGRMDKQVCIADRRDIQVLHHMGNQCWWTGNSWSKSLIIYGFQNHHSHICKSISEEEGRSKQTVVVKNDAWMDRTDRWICIWTCEACTKKKHMIFIYRNSWCSIIAVNFGAYIISW